MVNDSLPILETGDAESDAASLLAQRGILLWRSAISIEAIAAARLAAEECFALIEELIAAVGIDEAVNRLPPHYRFQPTCTSISPLALTDRAWQRVLRDLQNSYISRLLEKWLGDWVVCSLDRSWLRKQYAPHRYHQRHAPHSWHQDGGLGAQVVFQELEGEGFYLSAPLTHLVTCWLPLTPCGRDRPGLECALPAGKGLINYRYLHEAVIRREFAEFWQPEMQPGDLLVLHKGTLHRTHVKESMGSDRLAIDFRFFARTQIPEWMKADTFAQIVTD